MCAEQGPAYGSKQSGSKAAPSRVLLQPLPVVGTLQRAFAHVLAVGLVRFRSQVFKEPREGGLPSAGLWCVFHFALGVGRCSYFYLVLAKSLAHHMQILC